MGKSVLALLALLVFVTQAGASQSKLSERYNLNASFDFGAPVVSATSAVSDKQVGQIIYDVSTKQFKGLDSDGVWDAMTIPSGNPVTSSIDARVEFVIVNTICNSGSSCTMTSNSSGVSSVTRNTAGSYTVNFVHGTFSNLPACTFNFGGGVSVGANYLNTGTNDTFNFQIYDSSYTGTDGFFTVNCMGPR